MRFEIGKQTGNTFDNEHLLLSQILQSLIVKTVQNTFSNSNFFVHVFYLFRIKLSESGSTKNEL